MNHRDVRNRALASGRQPGWRLVARLRDEDFEFVRWLHGFDGEHGNPIALRHSEPGRLPGGSDSMLLPVSRTLGALQSGMTRFVVGSFLLALVESMEFATYTATHRVDAGVVVVR